MSKFSIILVLAFAAFQATNGATLEKLNTSNLPIRDVHEIINEIREALTELTDRLSQVLHQLANKFDAVKNEVNLPGLVDQLRKDISSTSASKSCSSAAQLEANLLQKNVMQATMQCSTINVNLNEATLKDLHQQLKALLEKVSSKVYKCVTQSFGNFQKFVKCMGNTVEEVREELKDVKAAADNAMTALEKTVPQLEKEMEECMTDSKQQVELKVQDILNELRTCSKTNQAVQRQLCWPNVHTPLCDDYDYDPWW